MTTERKKDDLKLPIAPPQRRPDVQAGDETLDLRIEEIEDKHVPKDRNIFDK